jgi:hypothetical protein
MLSIMLHYPVRLHPIWVLVVVLIFRILATARVRLHEDSLQ